MFSKLFIAAGWVVLLVFSPELCIFVTAGLAPAGVAYFVDLRPGKNTSATVLFFNLAGVTVPGMRFINGQSPLNFTSVLDPKVLLTVYLFAGMGYFIIWLVPKITVILVDYQNERRAVGIRDKISKLVEEWGPEVKKNY